MMRCAALPSPLGPVVLGLRRSGFAPTPCVSQGDGTTLPCDGRPWGGSSSRWVSALLAPSHSGGFPRRSCCRLLSPRSSSLPAKPAPTIQLWGLADRWRHLNIGPERIRLDEQRSWVSLGSRLGEKLTYIANQWDGLLVFLYHGRVEMDSNFVENRIRPVKLTAQNALFASHDEGAAAWGRIASLTQTCKRNGVEPYAWLKSTLEKIAGGHPQSRIRELLPWNFDPASS